MHHDLKSLCLKYLKTSFWMRRRWPRHSLHNFPPRKTWVAQMHRTIYNLLLRPTGWHLIPFPAPQRVYSKFSKTAQLNSLSLSLPLSLSLSLSLPPSTSPSLLLSIYVLHVSKMSLPFKQTFCFLYQQRWLAPPLYHVVVTPRRLARVQRWSFWWRRNSAY